MRIIIFIVENTLKFEMNFFFFPDKIGYGNKYFG